MPLLCQDRFNLLNKCEHPDGALKAANKRQVLLNNTLMGLYYSYYRVTFKAGHQPDLLFDPNLAFCGCTVCHLLLFLVKVCWVGLVVYKDESRDPKESPRMFPEVPG